MKLIGLFLTTLLFAIFAFAQDAVVVPSDEVIKSAFDLIVNWKTLASGAAALGVIQLLIKFFNSDLSGALLKKVTPEHKFLVIQGLSIIVGYLTLKSTGVSGLEAVVKTLALPIVVEFLHKLYKLYVEKKTA